jgi:hypothetical protein
MYTELEILLPQPLRSLDYRCELLPAANFRIFTSLDMAHRRTYITNFKMLYKLKSKAT